MKELAYWYSCEVFGRTYHWKSDEEASNNCPKEEAVIPDGLEYTKWTLELLGVEIEERATEMFDLPSGDLKNSV